MVTIKALETTVGQYGMLRRGQTARVQGSVGKQLVKEGVAELVEDEDGVVDPEPEVKGGIRITQGGDAAPTDVIHKETVITPEGVKEVGAQEPTVEPVTDLFETPKAEPAETRKAMPPEEPKTEPKEEKKAEQKETPKKK